jgi:hypothetical protein
MAMDGYRWSGMDTVMKQRLELVNESRKTEMAVRGYLMAMNSQFVEMLRSNPR